MTVSGSAEESATLSLVKGEPVTVAGKDFANGCLDDEPADDVEALQGVHLLVAQGSQRISVAQVDADPVEFGFETRLGIPATLQPGPAQLRAQTSLDADAEAISTVEFVVAEG